MNVGSYHSSGWLLHSSRLFPCSDVEPGPSPMLLVTQYRQFGRSAPRLADPGSGVDSPPRSVCCVVPSECDCSTEYVPIHSRERLGGRPVYSIDFEASIAGMQSAPPVRRRTWLQWALPGRRSRKRSGQADAEQPNRAVRRTHATSLHSVRTWDRRRGCCCRRERASTTPRMQS